MFPDFATLQAALDKVKRCHAKGALVEEFTAEEIASLKLWMAVKDRKLTRAERSERNRAAWSAGDRSQWGGERRKRDKRRGWRNFQEVGGAIVAEG